MKTAKYLAAMVFIFYNIQKLYRISLETYNSAYLKMFCCVLEDNIETTVLNTRFDGAFILYFYWVVDGGYLGVELAKSLTELRSHLLTYYLRAVILS